MYQPPPPPPDEMTQPAPARIRPLWLIGGGALVVVLGVCALISVAAAAVLIWFSSSIASHDVTPVPTRVAANPTQAATALLQPTALPPLSTAPPLTPTLDTSQRPPPDQAVRNYYLYVSQHRYDLSWPMLSEAFKQKFNCCAPNYDYIGYINWWNSVNHVEFGNVSTVSQNDYQAVVYAELYYVMNTGARSGIDSSPYFELVYDPANGGWRFNDKRASP